MEPHIVVIPEAHAIVPCNDESSSAYSDLVGSRPEEDEPLVAGVWALHDRVVSTDIFVAEWNEMKYVVRGTATIVDEISQQSHKLKQGSLVWIPKGSKASFSSSKDFYTVYVEQCHGQSGFKTGFEPVAKKSLKPQLDSLVATFASENPASLERHKRSQNTLAGGNTRAVLHEEPFPLAIESGYGPYVVSVDKRKYLDLVSDYSAGLFGHSNAVIADAVSRAVSNGFNLGGVTKVEVELGERIKQRFDGIEKIRFCNSGTEANTYALATAMTFTGRKKILVFDNGYHGGTLSFSSRGNPLNLPHDFVFGKYNNIEETRRLISSELAAIIVEPMLAAGGQIAATRDFLLFLREAANVTGAVLIFDEVVTSRLHVNGLQGFHNIKPDMTTLGKYLGGGLPFGAFGGRSDIMALFDPSRQKLSHSGTFNNNAFTMYAALAASDLVTEKEINRINKFGDTIREEVATVCTESGFSNLSATGFGSAVGFHFSGPESCLLRDSFFFFMLNRGIRVGRRGFIYLSLAHTESHIEQFIHALKEFIAEF